MATQTLSTLINNTTTQGNPIDSLRLFLEAEIRMETAKQVDRMRFVGYVLELGYDNAKIITSDFRMAGDLGLLRMLIED